MVVAASSPDRYFHFIRATGAGFNSKPLALDFPIVIHPDYGVFEPAVLFLQELERWRSAKSGVLADVAYIICQWCNHLQDIGRSWDAPSEVIFQSWLRDELGAGWIARARQARKANVLVRWYHFLASRGVGGALLRSFTASISASELDVSNLDPRARFKAPRGPKLKFGKRPIPAPQEVLRVIEALAEHKDPFIAERDWLLGRVAYETGLRAMGLESLTCRSLEDMLREDGLLSAGQQIVFMGRDRAAKARVRAALQQLQQTGRECLIGMVTEKGGKSRYVSFPIGLVAAILEHVWGERSAKIKVCCQGKGASALWLSGRTGQPLKRNSIKDILKIRGFNAAEAKGSGHSLRSAHLTDMACHLLAEAKSSSGSSFDTQAILFALAEIAGHSDPRTLEGYLNGARIRAVMMGDEAFAQMHKMRPSLAYLQTRPPMPRAN